MEFIEPTAITDELYAAISQMVKQLTSNAPSLTREELTNLIKSDSTRLIVARNEREIVGLLTLAIFQVPTGMRAWIEDFVVDKLHRRKGIGEILLDHAIQLAKDAGAKTVDLTSRPSREGAIQLYTKIGFKPRETNVFRITLQEQKSL
jgi:ribosomal protein S18 acetylase RimI-like enzyme